MLLFLYKQYRLQGIDAYTNWPRQRRIDGKMKTIRSLMTAKTKAIKIDIAIIICFENIFNGWGESNWNAGSIYFRIYGSHFLLRIIFTVLISMDRISQLRIKRTLPKQIRTEQSNGISKSVDIQEWVPMYWDGEKGKTKLLTISRETWRIF